MAIANITEHYTKCFIYFILFNLKNNPVREILILSRFTGDKSERGSRLYRLVNEKKWLNLGNFALSPGLLCCLVLLCILYELGLINLQSHLEGLYEKETLRFL